MSKIIQPIIKNFNIQSMDVKFRKVLKLIELLETGGKTRKFLMQELNIHQATFYRLMQSANLMLWDYRIIHSDGAYIITNEKAND